jgi:hypothetical protein
VTVWTHVMAAFLSGKTWWPLFPMLLLVVVIALSAAVVLAVKGRVAKADVSIQITALVCYLLTAVLRTLNLIAWGGILGDTALHYLITAE